MERQYYEAFAAGSAGDGCFELFAHALRADPFHPAGRYALAQVLAARGNYQEAAEHRLAIARKFEPSNCCVAGA